MPLSPTNTGGTPVSYSINPTTLPAGLAFDPNTGIISGRPTANSAAANYTITATNAVGNGTCTVNVSVTSPPLINGQISYNWTQSGSGNGTITATPGTLVHIDVFAHGQGNISHVTSCLISGAVLSGPMGNNIIVSNGVITETFTMPSSGSVTWSGYFSESSNDPSGQGGIGVY